MKVIINSIEITYDPIPNTGHPCDHCNVAMFSIRTPEGGALYTCALCGEIINSYIDLKRAGLDPYTNYSCKGEYCSSCGSIFDIADDTEVHANNGCTEDVFIAQLIESFEIKSNGKKYEGMPRFNSIKDVIMVLPMLKLNWINTKDPGYCSNASYPQ